MISKKGLEVSRKVYTQKVRVTEKAKRKRKVALLGFSVLFFLSCYLFYYFTTSKEFALQDYVVKGLKNTDRKSIDQLVQQVLGENIFLAELDQLALNFSSLGWVESVEIKRVFPNMISLHVLESTPFVYLKRGKSIQLMDKYGRYIEEGNIYKFDLPVVDLGSFGEEEGQQKITEVLQKIAHFVSGVRGSLSPVGYQLDEIRSIGKNNFEMYSSFKMNGSKKKYPLKIIVSEEMFLRDVPFLDKLVLDFKRKKKKYPALIDLRFEKMVVMKG